MPGVRARETKAAQQAQEPCPRKEGEAIQAKPMWVAAAVAAAATYGTETLSRLFLGSGGGGGGGKDPNKTGTTGGKGGGIIFIMANTVNVTGNIFSNGNAGVYCSNYAGSSGGGAGGSILIQAASASVGTGKVTATGGAKSVGHISERWRRWRRSGANPH